MALFFYNNKRKDKHMKTKLIGYGIILATFSNIIKAEPKDGEDVAQPSEAARFIAEVLQVQLRPNFIDVTLPWNYELNVLLTERQILALKYLCTQLGPQFGCDSIHPHTPLAKDLAALCDAYNPDSHYDFLLREPAPIHQDAFFREVFKSLSEKVKKQAETIKKLEAEKNDINEQVRVLKQETNKVTEENKQLTAKTQQAERQLTELKNQNKVLTEENAVVVKEIAAVKANSVDRAKILQRVRSSEAQGIVRKFEQYL